MDQHLEIIKRLEEENSLLKKQVSQLEADIKKFEKKYEKEIEIETHLAEDVGILRSIVENSLDGIILIGEDSIVQEWNRGFEDMLGISKAEAIGKNLWDVFELLIAHGTYSKEEIDDLRTRLNDVISRKQQTNFVRKLVNLQTLQERTIHTIYFPVYQGQTCIMCIVCRDITVNANKETEPVAEKEHLQVQVNIIR